MMLGHGVTLLSPAALAAHLACAMLAARLVRSRATLRQPSASSRTAVISGAAALASFSAMPPGSLRPFFNGYLSGAGGILLIWISVLLSLRQRPPSLYRERICAATLLSLTGVALAAYAWQRGIPGSPFNFGTYVAMPLWGISDWLMRLLLAALAIANVWSLRFFQPGMQRLAAAGLCVIWFVPWNVSSLLESRAAWALAADYLCFWLKTIALNILCLPAPQTAMARGILKNALYRHKGGL